jgi:hypothetical protein
MSDGQVIDAVLLAWAAALTVFLLFQIRGLSAIVGVLRDGGALGMSNQTEWRGPLIGAEAPAALTARLAAHGLADARVLVLAVSAGCGPCEQLLQDLATTEGPPVPLVVIFGGESGATRETAEQCAALIIEGSDGATLHAALDVNATPGIVGISAGVIDASALASRGLQDIKELATASAPLKAQVG